MLRGGNIFGSPVGAIVATSNGLRISNNYFDTDTQGVFGFGSGNNGLIELPTGALFGGAAIADDNVSVNGITVESDNVTIQNNRFGLAATGNALPSASSRFVRIGIGQSHVVRDNVFGGNPLARGVLVATAPATGALIAGNWFGLAPDGVDARPLRSGICLSSGATGILVGRASAADGNLIAHSLEAGIVIDNINGGATVQGNDIGINALGAAAPNLGGGIRLVSGSSNITIGGTESGAGNSVAFKTGVGIGIVSGSGNRMLGNSIFGNTGVEVDLGNGSALDGANVNDGLDGVPVSLLFIDGFGD